MIAPDGWEPDGFAHEKLDVYRAAVEFMGVAHRVTDRFPRGRSALRDQLERAAISIVLNIAEGSGEFSPKEKARFYRIAGRSAAECSACLDLAAQISALDAEDEKRGKLLLRRTGAMLVALARRQD
jgi:four helix bundle protein